MKDKQFKSKNRDTDFSKPKKEDIVLGRHNKPSEEQKSFAESARKKLYRNETAEIAAKTDNAASIENMPGTSVPDTAQEIKTDTAQNADIEINGAAECR